MERESRRQSPSAADPLQRRPDDLIGHIARARIDLARPDPHHRNPLAAQPAVPREILLALLVSPAGGAGSSATGYPVLQKSFLSFPVVDGRGGPPAEERVVERESRRQSPSAADPLQRRPDDLIGHIARARIDLSRPDPHHPIPWPPSPRSRAKSFSHFPSVQWAAPAHRGQDILPQE